MPLDLKNDEFSHGLVVEASAGTGKTYSVAAIVTRELALREDLRIGQILITTFTRNAAAELRDRVRRRLVETVRTLRHEADAGGDTVAAHLRSGTATEVAERIRRLERALVEFDSATISTIHGVCGRVLRAAGIEAGTITAADEADRIVAETVNDLVVTHSTAEHRWDEKKIRGIVDAMLADPFITLWIDPAIDAADAERLESLIKLLTTCVDRIQAAMAAAPSYNDLLRIARELVCDPHRGDLLATLKKRFRLAIVDEAQDTDRQQWEFFSRLFPGEDGRALISVGDPKQAIYGFRGADVRAYVDYAERAVTRRTLDVNFRSDQPVLDGLNRAFEGRDFGAGITYHAVAAPADRQVSRMRGIAGSVEFIELGVATSKARLAKPVLGKVIELLDDARLTTKDDPDGSGRPIEPNDICVLVRSSEAGRLIQQELNQANIPAVTGGTSSVMASAIAIDIRSLLEALERPSHLGTLRRAAATAFFGHKLTEVGVLTEPVIEDVQDRLMTFSGILAKKGIAALGAAIEADEAIMSRMAAGRHGERNITDFLHVIEVMDSSGPGRGCSPEQALAVFSRLANMDEKHDLVSRRVESDAEAVKIYTIHAAKGLEFPCVIVADLWKDSSGWGGGEKRPTVFYEDGPTREAAMRKLDMGFALGLESAHGKRRRQAAEDEESRRLLYVAATRARHSLGLLVARGKPTKNQPVKQSILEQAMTLPATLSQPNGRTVLKRSLVRQESPDRELMLAPPPTVERTYRRMSFTGITAIRGHGRATPFDPEGGGYDEPATEPGLALPALPQATAENRGIVDLPAGVAVGRVIHEIFEHVDPTARPLADEVRRVVAERAPSGRLHKCLDHLVQLVVETLETPLGGPFGNLTLGSISEKDRLSELNFEMGLASLTEGVKANAIGRLLEKVLPPSDPLHDYATVLASRAFDVPVGGLLTGSIDAVLRLPGSSASKPRLLLADYKSNKLHRTDMTDPLRAYHPDRLVAAMAEHHYPLQALLYGTAIYRMLRWRLPQVDPDDCIAGVAYAFIRGMKGQATPIADNGHRYGLFVWQSPRGLWRQLSDLLVTPQPTGAAR